MGVTQSHPHYSAVYTVQYMDIFLGSRKREALKVKKKQRCAFKNADRRKEIIKLRVEINETEAKKKNRKYQ